jgi:hypothetical protein
MLKFLLALFQRIRKQLKFLTKPRQRMRIIARKAWNRLTASQAPYPSRIGIHPNIVCIFMFR